MIWMDYGLGKMFFYADVKTVADAVNDVRPFLKNPKLS